MVEGELREPLEGKDSQARVALKRIVREQLAFELKRGLFGCEKNQRSAFGIFGQCGTHFREAAEGLAAAGGAEEKARLHDLFSRDGAMAQWNFVVNNALGFFISFPQLQVMLCSQLGIRAGAGRQPN